MYMYIHKYASIYTYIFMYFFFAYCNRHETRHFFIGNFYLHVGILRTK
jgi:hypothetical protein